MSASDLPACDASGFAPVVHWHDHDHDGHVVQFYADDVPLLESVSRFIGTALGAGDAAVVIATKAHRDQLCQRLYGRGFNVAAAIRQGRYVALDAAETLAQFMREDTPDAALFATVAGSVLERARSTIEGASSRVVAFGEMVALLWAEGKLEAALRLEQLWDELAQTHPFSLRCAYPITGFNREEHGELFLKICAQHSAVIPGENYATLLSDDERLRSIARLQQREQALETVKLERLEAQVALRRKQTELADVLENAVEGVQQVGPDERILWANKAMLQLLGYAHGEYVGHPLPEFYADRSCFQQYWQKLMRGEEIYDYPAELRCKDGSVKQVLIHSNGLWEMGKFVHTRCFVRDVTEQRRAEQALRESEAGLRQAKDRLESQVEQRTVALRRLSSQILALQDAERRRIARELHDSLGQYLVGLKLNLDLLRESPGQSELWAQSDEIMNQCLAEVRTLSYLLHPPMIDELGLISSARWFVDGIEKRSGVRVSLDVPDRPPRLPGAIELVLFRILQEALTNVIRHSGASEAQVRIRQEADQAILEVRDNGHGMPAELLDRFVLTGTGMGVGLTGMRERVGELGGKIKLEATGNGTWLQIVIPLAGDPAGIAS
jgi:PAS domain S-box-containing protein